MSLSQPHVHRLSANWKNNFAKSLIFVDVIFSGLSVLNHFYRCRHNGSSWNLGDLFYIHTDISKINEVQTLNKTNEGPKIITVQRASIIILVMQKARAKFRAFVSIFQGGNPPQWKDLGTAQVGSSQALYWNLPLLPWLMQRGADKVGAVAGALALASPTARRGGAADTHLKSLLFLEWAEVTCLSSPLLGPVNRKYVVMKNSQTSTIRTRPI